MNLRYVKTTLMGQEVMVAFYGPIDDYAFVWHGGAYIDVCFLSSMGTVELEDRFYNYGCQCINVFDYSKGEPDFAFGNWDAFISEIETWLENELPVRTA